MNMRKRLQTVLLAIALATASAAAQEAEPAWNPRSGDDWIDAQLADINDYAHRHRDPFIDEMVRYHDAPRDLVEDLLDGRRWAPGDVYYACSVAQVLGRPCRYVVDERARSPGEGWDTLAQRLGVAPDSPEFDRLKRGFVPSYQRWGRPLHLDDALREAFPEHGKPAGGEDER